MAAAVFESLDAALAARDIPAVRAALAAVDAAAVTPAERHLAHFKAGQKLGGSGALPHARAHHQNGGRDPLVLRALAEDFSPLLTREDHEKLVRADRRFWAGWVGLAQAHIQKKDQRRAQICLQNALNIDPGNPLPLLLRTRLTADVVEKQRALAGIDWASIPERHLESAALIAYESKLFPRALAIYEALLASKPNNVAFLHACALALRQMARWDEADAVHQRLLAADPLRAETWFGMANHARVQQDLDQAQAFYNQAIALDPANAVYRWTRATGLLLAHRLTEGLAAYEERWNHPMFPGRHRNVAPSNPQGLDSVRLAPRPTPVRDSWFGQKINGTLLVRAEQGQGDQMQFARFLPALLPLCGRLVVESADGLVPFFQAQPWAKDIIFVARGDDLQGVAYDAVVSFGSLPWRLGVREDTLCAAPFFDVARPPKNFFPRRPGRLTVGLVWAGNPEFSGDADRSLQFRDVAPLLDIPGVDVLSLQKGYATAQIPDGAQITHFNRGDGLDGWNTTAALVKHRCDVVVTSCTSMSHLAGGLGVPCWVMLGHDPDWRWLTGRTDSPWYTHARLFRQDTPHDWTGVVQDVANALRAKTQKRR